MPRADIRRAHPSSLNSPKTQSSLRLALILLTCALAPVALGQARAAAGGGFTPGFAGGHSVGGGFTPGFAGGPRIGGRPHSGGRAPQPGINGSFRHHPEGRSKFGTAFLGSPYWYDGGWYDSGPDAPEQAPTREAAVTRPPEPAAPPAQPLMIERQGDRFVRLTDAQVNPTQDTVGNTVATNSERPGKTLGSSHAQAQGSNDVPAVLVFRDGHQQEVASYSIIGGTLYESSSYYSSGYWTKKIQLAELDLPATLKLNQQRGVNFVLPGGPNQIVIRP